MKEDLYTNTVKDAEDFAKHYYEEELEILKLRDFLGSEEYDDFDDYDCCNCSDPGCPCGGIKSGGL